MSVRGYRRWKWDRKSLWLRQRPPAAFNIQFNITPAQSRTVQRLEAHWNPVALYYCLKIGVLRFEGEELELVMLSADLYHHFWSVQRQSLPPEGPDLALYGGLDNPIQDTTHFVDFRDFSTIWFGTLSVQFRSQKTTKVKKRDTSTDRSQLMRRSFWWSSTAVNSSTLFDFQQ